MGPREPNETKHSCGVLLALATLPAFSVNPRSVNLAFFLNPTMR